MLFGRVPRLSRPFARAAIVDAVGGGLLLGAVQPFAGVLARRLGAGPILLGFLSISPFLGFAASGLVTRLLFKFRWPRLLGLISALGRSLVILTGFTAAPFSFVCVLVLLQTSVGWGKVLFQTVLRAHVHGMARPNVFKWVRTAATIAAVPSAFFVGMILDWRPDSYRVLFPAIGLVSAACGLLFFRMPSRRTERLAHERTCGLFEEVRLLGSDRRFLLFMLAFFVGTLGEKIVMPIHPIYFADVLDLRYRDVGITLGVVGPVLSVGGFFFWARCARRFSPLNVLIVCMFLKALRPAFWACASIDAVPAVAFLAAGEAVFRFMIAGLEMGAVLSVLNMAREDTSPLYVGVHYLFMGIRGLLGPVIGVALYKAGVEPRSMYWIVAAVVTAGGFALVMFKAADRR
ncbi:MAG: MFS transporter [Kiritimatiellia bacterium]